MKKKIILGAFALMLGVSSCIKHEIIPAPEKEVELYSHVEGTVFDSPGTEWTQNVQGFYLDCGGTKLIQSSGPDKVIYFATMRSTDYTQYLKINIGSLIWDADVTPSPSLAQFNNFFTTPANMTPTYATSGDGGFEVVYRDQEGLLWISKDTDPGTVEFTDIIQDSDRKGDYSKFTCNFTCNVYHTWYIGEPDPDDPATILTADKEKSRVMDNVEFIGWFKR